MPLTTVLDLLLPVRCAGCDRPGPAWCDACRALLAEPFRVGSGRPRCYALAGYHGPARRAVLAAKERGRRDLAEPLGAALAAAVPSLPGARPAPDGVWQLVPAPSRPAANRRRWGGHLTALAHHCALALAASGRAAAVAPALRLDRHARDSVGLDVEQRRANLTGRVHPVPAGLPAKGTPVVLLDDVITTGSTAAACTEVLSAAGIRVTAVLALTAAANRAQPG